VSGKPPPTRKVEADCEAFAKLLRRQLQGRSAQRRSKHTNNEAVKVGGGRWHHVVERVDGAELELLALEEEDTLTVSRDRRSRVCPVEKYQYGQQSQHRHHMHRLGRLVLNLERLERHRVSAARQHRQRRVENIKCHDT
jgi:hypothetical protein